MTLCISFRNAQTEFEATLTFIDTAKVKLFTAENELSSKTTVSLDTPSVVIAGCGHCHLEYFIQDVDGDIFDRVSTHTGKTSQDFCKYKKSQYFLLINVCLVSLQRCHKSWFFDICRSAEIKCN